MWGKKKQLARASTLRYCQTAHELPLMPLYGLRSFTVAIAETCRAIHTAGEEERFALGVLHVDGIWGNGSRSPLLPCKIDFGVSRYEDHPPLGTAVPSLWTYGEHSHYRLAVGIEDSGPLFSKLEVAVAHARLSGRNFFHATFFKPRDSQPRVASTIAERDEHAAERKALAQRIEDGLEYAPKIVIESVGFDDRINTSAPPWATEWNYADSFEGTQFHDPNTARFRVWGNLPPLRVK